MSGILEFGFDDGKVISNQGIDPFALSKSGEKARISVISFKKFHDIILAQKANEKKAPLTDAEKAEYIAKIDARLSEQLKKPVNELTEIDKLDIRSPKFATSYTHFHEDVGTIRCLSQYEGNLVVKPEVCCEKFGDATQYVVMVVLKYPVDENFQVDEDMLAKRRYTSVHTWKMTAKKFKNLETAYAEARREKKFVMDLSVTLDGDPKFKKQIVTGLGTPVWAQEGADPVLKNWVLDQGMKAWKHVSNLLGFEMKKDKLLEKLNGGKSTSPSLSSKDASSDPPRLVSGYEDLL